MVCEALEYGGKVLRGREFQAVCHFGHGIVSRLEHSLGAGNSAAIQVLHGGHPDLPPELGFEVGQGKSGEGRQRVHGQLIGFSGIDYFQYGTNLRAGAAGGIGSRTIHDKVQPFDDTECGAHPPELTIRSCCGVISIFKNPLHFFGPNEMSFGQGSQCTGQGAGIGGVET